MKIHETMPKCCSNCVICRKEKNLIKICKCCYHTACLAQLIILGEGTRCPCCGAKFNYFLEPKSTLAWFLDTENYQQHRQLFFDNMWAIFAYCYLTLEIWENLRNALNFYDFQDTMPALFRTLFWMLLLLIFYVWTVDTSKYWKMVIQNWKKYNIERISIIIDENTKDKVKLNTCKNDPILSVPEGISDTIECRICHEHDSIDLISPCLCKGSLKRIHRHCLERWLKISTNDICEICLFRYRTVRSNVTFLNWLRSPENLSDRRYLMKSLLILLDFIPNNLIKFFKHLELVSRLMTSKTGADLSLQVAIISMKCFYFYFAFGYIYDRISSWNRENGTVQLILSEETDE